MLGFFFFKTVIPSLYFDLSFIMPEVIADITETTAVSTSETNTHEEEEEETHLDDGTLMEEMKKAVKQGTFFFSFFSFFC